MYNNCICILIITNMAFLLSFYIYCIKYLDNTLDISTVTSPTVHNPFIYTYV